MLLCNTDEEIEKESDYIDKLISTGVDGVLITPTGVMSRKNLKKLQKYNIPYTLIDRKIDQAECDLVLGDNHAGTKNIIQHFIDNGHKRIGMIHAPLDISTAEERYEAYMDTLRANQLPFDEKLVIQSHYKKDKGSDLIAPFYELPKNERPTAIFAANNFIAIDSIRALNERGIRVPEDMAIACFDDLDPYLSLEPFLTVSSQPAYDFGYTGVQFLIERVEGNAPPSYRKIVLQSELLIRKSSLNTQFRY